MIPDSVRSLAEIHQMPGQDEQLVHAVSLLDFLTAVSPSFGRGDDAETLSAVVNRNQQLFSQIADLRFALRVRNKIIHPRPANADDPDLYPSAVRRAARHVMAAIEHDVASHVPPEIYAVLLARHEATGDPTSASAQASELYVAGWRYEAAPSPSLDRTNGSAWLPSVADKQRLEKSPSRLAAFALSLQSMSSGKFWGLMSCIPPALIVVFVLLNKLNTLLPGSVLVYGAIVLLTVTAFRWLRAG